MKKAGSIIKNYFDSLNFKGEEASLNYTGIWRCVTGKNIERCTRPVALKNGTLFVEVEDSIWLYQLTMLKDKIIADFNTLSGDSKITNIVFRNTGFSLSKKNKSRTSFHGKKDSNIEEQKITLEELSCTETNEIKKMIFHVPISYQERLGRLISSFYGLQQWKRKKGAQKCTRCHSLFIADDLNKKADICHICYREKKDKE